MSEISELEARLLDAMKRIRAGLETQAQGQSAGHEDIEERLSVLSAERDAARMSAQTSEQALEAAQAQLATLQAEVTELRETVGKLHGVNAQLRDAASAGTGQAEAINAAMAADLAALQKAREDDLRDVENLLSLMERAPEEADHA